MCRHLVLIRHAQTDSCYSGRYLGVTDVPLSDSGRRQAAGVAKAVGELGPQICFCSPLRRARQTLDPLMKSSSVTVEFLDSLREIDFGQWEGLTFEEIARRYPSEVSRWAGGDLDFAFPGGESIRGFIQRIERAADRMVNDPADTVAAVTHGGVIRFMICHLLGLPYEKYIVFDVRHASLTCIDVFDGKGVLTGLHDLGCREEL